MELGVTAVMLPELDFAEQIALCTRLGVKHYQYRPRIIPEDQRGKPYSNWGNHKFDLTPARLVKEGPALTRQLREAGLEPCGTVPSLTLASSDDDIQLGLEGAAAADAKAVRIAPYGYPQEPFDYPALLTKCLDRYRHIIETMAAPRRIKIIIETHCGSLATSPGLALNLCREFPPEQIGVIFDIANYSREGAVRPALAVSVLRDYIDCCHIGGGRMTAGPTDAFGSKEPLVQSCSLADGDLHLPSWLRAIRAAGISPPLLVEDYRPNMSGADRLTESATWLRKVLAAI